MALASVLLVTVVMLALAAAFFASHRADLALLTTSTYREQTKNACLSVADILQYKLQNNRNFGAVAFSDETETFPNSAGQDLLSLQLVGNGKHPKANRIIGKMPLSDVEFEVRLVNNLKTSTVTETLEFDPESPPRTARAWVTARRGNVTSHIDVIFKQSPFTTASITSNSDINVELANSDGYWLLGAMQQSGNNVRASGKIRGPEVWSPTGAAVQFTAPPGMERKAKPPYGTMQGKELEMQVDGVYTYLKPGMEKTVQSEATIKGVLSSGGGDVKIPELEANSLQGASRKVSFPHSNIVFETVENGRGEGVHRLMSDGRELAHYNPSNYGGDKTFAWYDQTGHRAASFDLENRVMTVSPDIELQVDSKFSLSSTTQGQSFGSLQPTLVLGNSDRGAGLQASGVDIDGSVGGFGAIKSSGSLNVAAKSSLSTTPDFGIALHAKGDVTLTKPGANANDGLAGDFEAFKRASGSGSNTTLDRWGYLDDASMATEASSFKGRSLAGAGGSGQFQSLWDGLTADFPADQRAISYRDALLKAPVAEVTGPDPDPNWEPTVDQPERPIIVTSPAEPGGAGVTIDNYVRLREYLRSVKKGAADASWLEANPDAKVSREQDVTNLVKNQLSSFQLSAGQQTEEVNGQPVLSWNSLSSFFKGTNPYSATYAPDMLFRGLVYTEGNFVFDTQRQGVYIEGALVARGNVDIKNASGAQFVYNSDLLQNLFAPEKDDFSIPLERAYWAFY